MEIEFEKLDVSDLMVDAVYKGGTVGGKGAEVLSKLMPGCSNSGGFRKVMLFCTLLCRNWLGQII